MRDKILAILSSALPQIDFTSSDKLVDDKILDSISLITLVSELSINFNIKIGMNELTPENFNSIDSIVSTVQRLQKAK